MLRDVVVAVVVMYCTVRIVLSLSWDEIYSLGAVAEEVEPERRYMRDWEGGVFLGSPRRFFRGEGHV